MRYISGWMAGPCSALLTDETSNCQWVNDTGVYKALKPVLVCLMGTSKVLRAQYCTSSTQNQGIHQMYMLPKFSLSVASPIRRCT